MTSTIKAASRRMTAILAVFLVAFGIMTQTLVAKPVQAAYHQAYIQTTLDTSTWEILAGAVDVTSGAVFSTEPQEARRMKGMLDTLAGCSMPADASSHINTSPSGSGGNDNLILTFPGKFGTVIKSSSSEADLARASMVRTSLVYDLNSAFKLVYGQNYRPSGSTIEEQIDNYWEDMKTFLGQVNGSSGSLNGYTFEACSDKDVSRFPDAVTDESDYVKITGPDNIPYVFQYRMLKGYLDGGGRTGVADKLGLREGSSSSDVAFVHWGHLAVEASVNFNCDDKLVITSDNVYNSTPTAFEKAISGFFVTLANGISSALGLWSFDELIFNAKLRGTPAYIGGIFPATWQSLVWGFFYIFEIAAIVILLYAIIFNVGRRAMSTMNPIIRANAIEQIQYLFMVALALGLLPITLQLLINVNMNLTGIFTDALGTDMTAAKRFESISASSGSLMSALTSLVYLGAVIYFNVFYGIRSLMVCFLIMTGPIFIAMMGVNESKRRLTIAWAKELAANIFIQPLQAMMLAFILLVPGTSRNIDSLIMVYAMIPLTNVMRGLMFGDSGGLLHQLAERGQRTGTNMLKTGAKLAGAGAIGAVAGGATAIGGIVSKKNGASESESNNRGEERTESSSSGGANSEGKPTANAATNVSQDGTSDSAATASKDDAAASGVEAGTSTESTKTGNQVYQSMTGESASEPETAAVSTQSEDVDPVKAKGTFNAAGFALAAGAVAAGALGGGMNNISRRVFGVRNGGAMITQASRILADRANARFHPVETNSQEAPITQPNDTPEMTPNAIEKKDYSAVTSNEGNAFEREIAEKTPLDKDFDQYRIDRDDMRNVGIRRTRPIGEEQSMVSYDMNKLGAGDSARASAMLDMWNNGNAQEKALLQNAGITDVRPRTKMVGGSEQVTGIDMTVDNAAFAENFGTSFDKNGMTLTTDAGAAPQMVPDVTGYISQTKAAINNGNDICAAHSTLSQVAQSMGVEQGTSMTLDYPQAMDGSPVAGPPVSIPTTTFTASSQEALTSFMNEAPQLKSANAAITPIVNEGSAQYQVSIPTAQYDGLLATQEMPNSPVYTDIMSARPAASAPQASAPIQEPQVMPSGPETAPTSSTMAHTVPMPQPTQTDAAPVEVQPAVSSPVAAQPMQTDVPVMTQPVVNSPVEAQPVQVNTPEAQPVAAASVAAQPVEVVVQQGGETASAAVETPIQVRSEPVQQDIRDRVPVKEQPQESSTQPRESVDNHSREQEKQGGQFRQ